MKIEGEVHSMFHSNTVAGLLAELAKRPGKRHSDKYSLKRVDTPIYRGERIIGIRSRWVPVDPENYIPLSKLLKE